MNKTKQTYSTEMQVCLNKLKEYVNSSDYQNEKIKEKKIVAERDAFVNKFTYDFISNDMTLDDYCFKAGTKGSFCHDIEQKLRGLGSITGGSRAGQLYGIYSDAKIPNMWHYKEGKKTSDTKDRNQANAIYNNIRKDIVTIIKIRDGLEKGKDKDINKFEEIKSINSLTKNKIEFIYSDLQSSIPIYANEDLTTILRVIGEPVDFKWSPIRKRLVLFEFYKNNVVAQYPDMTPYLFMAFLYNGKCGYRYELGYRDSKKPEVATDESIERELLAGEIDPKRAKEIGVAGENKIEEELQKRKDNGEIRDYHKYCDKNDTKGYDFDYITNEGVTKYVEVKTTTLDYKDDKKCFLISAKEFETYKKNKDIYYVFYITGIFSKNPTIHQLTQKDLEEDKFTPTKYKFNNK